jgi:hypothetical protein
MNFISRKNVDLLHPDQLEIPSFWRRISLASWSVTADSSIVAILELDADPALQYIARASSVAKITMTSYVGWILGKVLKKHPLFKVAFKHTYKSAQNF